MRDFGPAGGLSVCEKSRTQFPAQNVLRQMRKDMEAHMNKPYAESTLRRKYRETGIPRDLIDTAIAYLHACAEFFYAVEIDDIISILQRQGNISPETLNTLLPIFARDDALSFYIENEKELYQDGKDKLWLISKDYLCVENPECTDDDLRRFATDESYDGPAPLMEEWERFYELNKQRAGKKQYVPKNILLYAQEDYYEPTQQATAMLRFLKEKVDDPELVLLMMLDIIKDVTVPMTKTIQVVMEKTDYKPSGMAEMGEFTRLFTDLSNNMIRSIYRISPMRTNVSQKYHGGTACAMGLMRLFSKWIVKRAGISRR